LPGMIIVISLFSLKAEPRYLAAKNGWAINVGGGMHHASFNDGGGWCIYRYTFLGLQVTPNLAPEQRHSDFISTPESGISRGDTEDHDHVCTMICYNLLGLMSCAQRS
jgi:hypothetical protein